MRTPTELILDLVSARSTSGWKKFDCPACGDRRRRGGVRIDGEGFYYHCFNGGCPYVKSTGWQPGSLLGKRVADLMRFLGATDVQVGEAAAAAGLVKDKKKIPREKPRTTSFFKTVELPPRSTEVDASSDCPAAAYLRTRGSDVVENHRFFWSPSFPDHLVVPFFFRQKIVGYQCRRFVGEGPRFSLNAQEGYMFNHDTLDDDLPNLLVMEGTFDAIATGGLAIMRSTPTSAQLGILSDSGKKKIVVPQRDRAGLDLVKVAIVKGWDCAVVDWPPATKDAAEAVKDHGMLWVVEDIVQSSRPAQEAYPLVSLAISRRESQLGR